MISHRHVATFAALCASSTLLSGCGSGSTSDDSGGEATTSNGKEITTSVGPAESTTTTTTTTFDVGSVYSCTSDKKLEKGVAAADKKGFCVDDTTMTECPDEMFGLWPHATERVTSYRMFAAWKPDWKGDRVAKWKALKAFLDRTGSTVLLGAEIQRGRDNDEQFKWSLELLKLLGKERVLAFAFGNELEYHGGPPEGYWDMVVGYAKQIDDAGFKDLPLTAVFSQQIVGKMVNEGFYVDLVKKMASTFKKRWIWAYNTYSIWDNSVLPHGPDNCKEMTDVCTTIKYIVEVTKKFRDQVTEVVGNEDYQLWITETGWSSPAVSPQHDGIQGYCPYFGSKEAFYQLYKSVAEWDLSLGDDKKNVDRLFYFAMRDRDFNGAERFGLVQHCGDKACKVGSTALGNATEVLV